MQKKTLLISLIGHQPLPNLLSLRYEKPDEIMFINSHTKDDTIKKRTQRLNEFAEAEGIDVIECSSAVDPWDIANVSDLVGYELSEYNFEQYSLVFDVTGGTKAMSLGLAKVAENYSNECDVRMNYLQSESYQSIIGQYRFEEGQPVRKNEEKLYELLTIQEFLYLHVGGLKPKNPPKKDEGAQFEQAVYEGFEKLVDEIDSGVKPLASEDADLILRTGNRFAIVECKTGGGMKGIYQLNNLASERYLGTYTQKILAVNQNYRKNESDNAEVADMHNIYLLELPEWEPGHQWTENEIEKFQNVVRKAFGK